MKKENMKKDLNEMKMLLSIKQIVFNLDKENISLSAETIINVFDKNFPTSFNIIITQMIYGFLVGRIHDYDINIYLNFIKEIETLEDNNKIKSKIFETFSSFLLNKDSQESYYLLENMIGCNFLDSSIAQNKKNAHFAQYMEESDIKKFFYIKFMKQVIKNIEELKKDNWKLHKKLIKEGVNPNEIPKIIQNDEVDKLQEISSQNDFDFNKYIKPSLYERSDFINQKYVSLIDYAAFFGSIKCFKYLLMNGANVKNTGKYAVAGGNLEIIHLCEQNHSSFDDAYETAIMFHRNDIFHYLYEKKYKNLEILGIKCIMYHNYEIFMFLLDEGMKIYDSFINEAAKIGNIFLIKYCLQNHQIPKDILVFSSESGNIELVKYVLSLKSININTLCVYLLCLKFVLFLWNFNTIFGNYLFYFIQHL